MNYVAQAIRSARDEACGTITMESILSDLDNQDRVIGQITEDQETMTVLAEGLTKIAVSAESVSPGDYVTQNALRLSAVEHLRVAGMDDAEAQAVFPSLEAVDHKTGWERFKVFIDKLWDFIVKAAKQIFSVVDGILKKSSVAEKMAMTRMRLLREEFEKRKAGLSVSPTIQLRPAHAYLLSPTGELQGMVGLRANIDNFRKSRDAMQAKLPVLLDKVTEDLVKACNQLNVTNPDDAVVSATIENNSTAILNAVRPMFPEVLARELGAVDYKLPLIFDRVIEINNPSVDDFDLDSDEGAGQYIAQLGTEVVQVKVPGVDVEKLGTFPAMRIQEIEETFKLCRQLLDEGHSTDQRRQWYRTRRQAFDLDRGLSAMLRGILKRQGLSLEARATLKMALNAKAAAGRWVSAPYVQINAVNVRVVQSLLTLIQSQLQNLEVEGGSSDITTSATTTEKRSKV